MIQITVNMYSFDYIRPEFDAQGMTQGCRSLLHEGALSRSEFATAHSGHSDGFEWAPQGGQNFTPHQSAEVAMREGGIGQWAVELFWFALLTKIIHTRNINKQRKQTFVHIRI